MLYKEYVTIKSIVVHTVGNKLNQDNFHLSKQCLSVSDELKEILTNYFLSPFKSSEYFTFYHDIDINMNEVFVCANKIFDNPETLLEQSQNL
ncbi:MAG: nucleoid-associated protein, partial [Bacteroidales bacterium]|nr:nucleoid-associated protein [Bacteroidales bacterium]